VKNAKRTPLSPMLQFSPSQKPAEKSLQSKILFTICHDQYNQSILRSSMIYILHFFKRVWQDISEISSSEDKTLH